MAELRRLSILCVAALLLGCESLPWPDQADTRDAMRFHRGHKPRDAAAENLSVEPRSGLYPPRALGLAAQTRPPSDSWLLDADSDRDRWRRLEVVLGGMDRSMWEVGVRFVEIQRAIAARDFELAAFEWDKVRRALEVAALKRPRGQEVIEKGFLEGAWARLDAALGTKDAEQARAAFLVARGACMACHTTIDREFLNRGRVFQATAAFPAPAAPAGGGGER